MDFNCQSVVNPLVDIVQVPADDIGNQATASSRTDELIKMYEAMNQTGDEAEQKKLMRAYEKRVLDDEAHSLITLWWYRIIPHRVLREGLEDHAQPLPEPGPRRWSGSTSSRLAQAP